MYGNGGMDYTITVFGEVIQRQNTPMTIAHGPL